MTTQTTHVFSNIPLAFHSASKETLPVDPVELILMVENDSAVECRLIFTISLQAYQQTVDAKALFNLYPEVKGETAQANFSPDNSIELEVRLSESLLEKLEAKGLTAENVAGYLSELYESEPSSILFFADSWYCLSVKQAISLPDELAEQGELKVGYRTTWGKERASGKNNQVENLEKVESEKSMLDVMTNFFTKNGQSVYQWEGETVFSFPYQGKNGQWRCYADAKQAESVCCLYSICPLKAPLDKRFAIAEFITRVNYILIVGNFEMDFTDGEIRCRTSIDVEGSVLTTPLFRQMTIANFSVMDRYLPGIMGIIHDALSPEEALATVD